MHPLVKLAANAVPNERRYICLAGAGLSIDANVPTAWGLMLATAQLIRAKDGTEGDERDIETWFMESEHANLRYDQLIGDLFPTSAAQRDFMRDKLRADEPGQAHRLLAELARLGVLRCIITTNFDTLIEQALRERGLTIQVISNDEQLRTSGPLIQCKEFRVYKPHGTIDGGRLRNTPKDLEKLTGPMERELARVISDHGLIVLGYAGADRSIQRIFEKKRQYLYPTFWVNPRVPTADIPALFGSGTFDHIPCTGASTFLNDLMGMYRKLDAMVPKTGLETIARTAEEAIRTGRPDAGAQVTKFWGKLASELSLSSPFDLSPNRSYTQEVTYEHFLGSLDRTVQAVLAFSGLADAAAEMNSEEGSRALFKGFELLAKHYSLPKGVGGHFDERWFDFWRFAGHELLVVLFVSLMRNDRWELMAKLFLDEFFVENPRLAEPGMRTYEYFAPVVYFFLGRDRELNYYGRHCHGQKLGERYRSGSLADRITMREFAEADYLLGLRSAFLGSYEDAKCCDCWLPHSIYYLYETPRFLFRAQQRIFAERLLGVLAVPDIETLRSQFGGHRGILLKATGDPTISRAFQQFNANTLGSR